MKKRILSALLLSLLLISSFGGIAGCANKLPLLSIIYDGSYLQKRYAYEWSQMLVETVDALDAEDVRITDRTLTRRHYRVELCESSDVGDGNWRIERVDDKCIKIYAADGYGFISASRYFANAWKASGTYTESVAYGSYLQTLTLREESNRYAFARRGEYRVMFYNVLWWDPAPEERNYLNAEVVARYRPDVLGLQEVNETKRGYAEDGKGGLIDLLADYGYVEAVDPVVDNASRTEFWLSDVRDENNKLLGYKPTTSPNGATKLDASKYGMDYTFYNCTPLLYNQYTTKCVAAEYYWYKNQWDLGNFVENEYGAYYETKHENWANDCASKAATWGVFESIATGERYIAISTHMCTRSGDVAALQAEELIALIDELIAQYQCPVILGGDYNGTVTYQHYRLFADSGLLNVRRPGVASVFASQRGGHHTYPVYDEAAGLVLPAENDNTGKIGPDKSVDHIMIKNNETMDVAVFGIVIDDCTMSGADHFPMYMDFSIHPKS